MAGMDVDLTGMNKLMSPTLHVEQATHKATLFRPSNYPRQHTVHNSKYREQCCLVCVAFFRVDVHTTCAFLLGIH